MAAERLNVQTISGRYRKLHANFNEPKALEPHEFIQLSEYLENLQDCYNEAEPLLTRVLFHAEKAGTCGMGRCAHLRLNLGRTYLFQGRCIEARAAFKRAMDLARDARDAEAEAEIGRFRLMFEMLS